MRKMIAVTAFYVGLLGAGLSAAPVMAQAPGQTGGTPSAPGRPVPAPPSISATKPANPAAASVGRQFTSEQQAGAECAGDTVVWVNSSSKIYHFKGARDYGHTKAGAYMCERAAGPAGFRAAKNEKHP